MKREFGSNPEEVIQRLGHLSVRIISEVSEDVIVQFEEQFKKEKL